MLFNIFYFKNIMNFPLVLKSYYYYYFFPFTFFRIISSVLLVRLLLVIFKIGRIKLKVIKILEVHMEYFKKKIIVPHLKLIFKSNNFFCSKALISD